jgi:hypothetical protein
MLWPGERIIRRIVRQWRQDRLLLRLHQAGQRDVYAGLLAYAKAKGWKPGWAYFAFLEIFGAEPRPQDRRAEPKTLPDFLIEEWAARRKRPQR